MVDWQKLQEIWLANTKEALKDFMVNTCPPHKPVRRTIGPFHPQFVAENRELLEQLTKGMSDYVCSECGIPLQGGIDHRGLVDELP